MGGLSDMEGDEIRRQRVLAIFAHPDDEVFRCSGTLALLAKKGVAVHLLTVTRGQAGSCGDPSVCTPEELPVVREEELLCACEALGIAVPQLLDYSDGSLVDVDEEEGAAQVLLAIKMLRPQVLLTWPPDGLSGHPDHVAVSRWTRLAFEQAGTLGRDAPDALYHLAVPRSVAEALGLTRLHALPDDEVSLAVDVTPVWEQKMAAIRCHQTQAGSSPILCAPPERQRLFLGQEHFYRSKTRVGHDALGRMLA